MSEEGRLFTIGRGPAMPAHLYLRWTRIEALTDFILRSCGTLDAFDCNFSMPSITLLPATEGLSTNWPERYLLERVSP